MPEDRKIIFGTYVVPTYSIEREETSVTSREFQSSPAGTLGGKGSASITATQWGDGWVSFAHSGAYWEDQSDVWELQGEVWDGELGISDSATDLTDNTDPCKFLYIKNTGATYGALVALDGGTNYYIQIPPGGSVHLRGDGTQLLCSEVFAKCASGETTTIEFIIAK